jgi:hypothetical protein
MKTLLLLLCATSCANIHIASAGLDTAKIDQITGLKGKLNEKEGGLQGNRATQRNEGDCRRMDNATNALASTA